MYFLQANSGSSDNLLTARVIVVDMKDRDLLKLLGTSKNSVRFLEVPDEYF